MQALALMLKTRAWPASPEGPRWQMEASGFQREAAAIFTPKMRLNFRYEFVLLQSDPPPAEDRRGEAPLLFPAECPITLKELLDD